MNQDRHKRTYPTVWENQSKLRGNDWTSRTSGDISDIDTFTRFTQVGYQITYLEKQIPLSWLRLIHWCRTADPVRDIGVKSLELHAKMRENPSA